MTVSIIVPFRSDGAERDRNWAFLRARYQELYPEWEIVEGTCEGPWSKGACVNAAVEVSSGDVLVIADADVMVGEDALRDAVGRLKDSAWVVPHRMVHRLNEAATEAVIAGTLRAPVFPRGQHEQVPGSPRRGPQGGGVSIMRREDFVGMDERFLDWGGEDISFARALDTMVGHHRCLGQVMWHLYHEPMPRREGNRASPESEELAARYADAFRNRVAMAELLTQRPYAGVRGGGIVVVPREMANVIDPRFIGWGQEDECAGVALECLAGVPYQGEADLVHLHHPPAPRISRARGSAENWALRSRYLQAQRNPQAMRELIEES